MTCNVFTQFIFGQIEVVLTASQYPQQLLFALLAQWGLLNRFFVRQRWAQESFYKPWVITKGMLHNFVLTKHLLVEI